MGWKVVNRFPTELKKYIIIVAPHTSWVDFPVGVFVNYSEKLGANYIAKHTLFKPPFGFMFNPSRHWFNKTGTWYTLFSII